MVAAVSPLTIKSILDKPKVVFEQVEKLFPTMSAEQLSHAWTHHEIAELLERTRDLIKDDPDIAGVVVAHNEDELLQLVLYEMRGISRRIPEESWDKHAIRMAASIAASLIVTLTAKAMKDLEEEFVSALTVDVSTAYDKWVNSHPSFPSNRHLHFEPVNDEESSSPIVDALLDILDRHRH